MIDEYLNEYIELKEKFEREVKRHPSREHELTLLYSPVLNYLAVRYTDQVIKEEWLKEMCIRHEARRLELIAMEEQKNDCIEN